MKKVYTLLVALLLTATLWAQSPEKINYQAAIRDASDKLVTSQAVGMQISILQGSASGTAVYVETQSPTTNVNGLVSVEIGSGTVVSGDFTTIDWSTGSYFITTETDPTGGSDYTISGTSQLLSVPYALYAKIAENYNETDPLFSASPFIALTQEDIDNWTNKLDEFTELDPVFLASFANTISEADTAYWNNKLDEFTELDSVFLLSLANAISETDITYWNSKLDEFTETDPVFLAHPSSGITEDNIDNWKDIYDWYTADEDYLTKNSPAGGITEADTARWNDEPTALVESDPIFLDSYAYHITQDDSLNLRNLSGYNSGDQLVPNLETDYATIEMSDTITAFRVDSIAAVRDALKDSTESLRIALNDSIAPLRIALNDSIEDVHVELHDSIAKIRTKLDDLMQGVRAELNSLSSISSFHQLLNDSIADVHIGLKDTIEDVRTGLKDTIVKLRTAFPGLHIGELYGGGIIFWLDASGKHGLIADKDDLGVKEWGTTSVDEIGTTGFKIYAGMSNTNLIIANQPGGYAADSCAGHSVTLEDQEYGTGVYSEYYDDWYLPSVYELEALYNAGASLGNHALSDDSPSGGYWTSTSLGGDEAYLLEDGSLKTASKSSEYNVRAIRAF